MPASTTARQQSSPSVGSPTYHYLIDMEAHLRAAGRLAELVGVIDPEIGRLSGVCFRLAQRVGVDGGRLERAA